MKFYEVLIREGIKRGEDLTVLSEEDAAEALAALAHDAACQVLEDIRDILEDDTTSDQECFRRILRIVDLYEALDGERHRDFR